MFVVLTVSCVGHQASRKGALMFMGSIARVRIGPRVRKKLQKENSTFSPFGIYSLSSYGCLVLGHARRPRGRFHVLWAGGRAGTSTDPDGTARPCSSLVTRLSAGYRRCYIWSETISDLRDKAWLIPRATLAGRAIQPHRARCAALGQALSITFLSAILDSPCS